MRPGVFSAVFVAVVCAFVALVQAQQSLDREVFDNLLQMVSPDCREMMEELSVARESGTESDVQLTAQCQREVQVAFQSIASAGGIEAALLATEEAAVEAPVKEGSAISTVVAVLAFLAVLFGGAGALVVYVYRERKDFFKERPEKKLSKQKQLKKRIKESRKQN